jgi:hypothetical protein
MLNAMMAALAPSVSRRLRGEVAEEADRVRAIDSGALGGLGSTDDGT